MSKRLLGPGLVTVAYTIGFGALSAAKGNHEFIYYTAVMVLLIGGIFLMDRRIGFSAGVLWALAVWGFLHMGGGNIPIPEGWIDQPGKPAVLYNLRPASWLPRYDQAVHAYGFAVATFAAWEALRAATGIATVSTGFAIALAMVGMGLGATNEVVEFVATRFMETNVGGYENTGWDLVSNGVGAVCAAAVIRARARGGEARS